MKIQFHLKTEFLAFVIGMKLYLSETIFSHATPTILFKKI
jgi:hypothetical protein